MQAKKIRARRKSLFSSTKFSSKIAINPEDQVEPSPEASWAPSGMISEGLTEHCGAREEGCWDFFCLEGNMRFSGENVIRRTPPAALPFTRGAVSFGGGRWLGHPHAFGADPQLCWCRTNSIPGMGKHWAELRTCPNSCCSAPITPLF